MQKNKSSHWYRGLHALHFGGIHGLVALVFVAVLSATMLSPRWVQQASAAITPFSASSFWNNPVPAYTALDPQSASFAAQVSSQVTQYGASFNTTTSSPVYVVDSTTPTVTVEPWDCGVGAMPDLTAQWQSVPIPFYAVPSAGANAQMVIYQPDSATTWEFGHMRNVTGQWQACTGGRVTTSGDGVFQSPYGVSSSGLSTLASQLTPDEIRSGYIDHVIALALPQTNGFTSPATQGSGGNAGAPALGSRLRLDPAVNIDNLGLNAAGRAIARAAQTYGFVVWNTASTVSISGYNPVAQTSRSIADPYAGLGVSSALAQFPWDRLQALPTSTNFATAEPAITAFSVSKSNIGSGQTVTLSWQSANVNRCAIPGLRDNLPASGTIVTKPLTASTTFVLRCGGPTGAASSQLSIVVLPGATNDQSPVIDQALIVTPPYSGYANILPDLMPPGTAEKVYKVVYYEASTYLYETAKPPYALNTSRMDNGAHSIDAQIYYRDGTSDRKSLGISVSNTPETLFATVQSGMIKGPSSIPLPYAILAVLLVLGSMAGGSLWGWHKAHLS